MHYLTPFWQETCDFFNSMWYNLQWDELNVEKFSTETIQYFEDLGRFKFFRDALI